MRFMPIHRRETSTDTAHLRWYSADFEAQMRNPRRAILASIVLGTTTSIASVREGRARRKCSNGGCDSSSALV